MAREETEPLLTSRPANYTDEGHEDHISVSSASSTTTEENEAARKSDEQADIVARRLNGAKLIVLLLGYDNHRSPYTRNIFA